MKHYDVSYAGEPFDYKGSGFGTPHLPVRDAGHVDRIINLYQAAIRQEEEQMKNAGVRETRDGYYLKFQNVPDYDLALSSIDNSRIGHIVSVKDEKNQEGKLVTSAILYLKKDKQNWLTDKAEDYKHKAPRKGQKNQPNTNLIETIEDISAVGMNSLWTGKGTIPAEQKDWVELWFKGTNANPSFQLIRKLGIEHKELYLEFPERIVFLVHANRQDLEKVFFSSNSLVRISEVPTLAGFIPLENGIEQEDWMKMIMNQFKYDCVNDKKYLCLLDTGVVNGHPMLQPVLDDRDRFAVDEKWGSNDTGPHGTLMAGVAVYGDMTEILAKGRGVEPRYRLCSVKILPSSGDVLKESWGKFTKQAVSIAEIGRYQMPEVMAFCMAITETNGYCDGTPSSWSSAIDQICSGAEDGIKRLFIQSAGNVRDEREWANYPDANKTLGIMNPSQAWNSLTVGAFTEKIRAFDKNGNQMRVVAPEGGLSPFSTTSYAWSSQTPIKPEIVMEGGNLAINDKEAIVPNNDLELLTTHNRHFVGRPFTTINATSAASALASRYASILSVENPGYWPETVRGLFVHTAQWTEQMMKDFPDLNERLRVCGYGVPDLEKMMTSRANGVTFIAQKTIQPYTKGKNGPSFNKMHVFTLPWPKETLLDLGDKEVTLTITLSYFIEPGPTDNFTSSFKKYAYASSGLRFELSTYKDSKKSFVNRLLREYDEDEMRIKNDTGRWSIGVNNRTKGSIHKDWIKCMAADLVKCNMIAVYPVSGWWHKRTGLRKLESEMRYSLIVSLECGEEQVNFSTEIENMIPIEQQVQIEI